MSEYVLDQNGHKMIKAK